jgi:hypothetical protein
MSRQKQRFGETLCESALCKPITKNLAGLCHKLLRCYWNDSKKDRFFADDNSRLGNKQIVCLSLKRFCSRENVLREKRGK